MFFVCVLFVCLSVCLSVCVFVVVVVVAVAVVVVVAVVVGVVVVVFCLFSVVFCMSSWPLTCFCCVLCLLCVCVCFVWLVFILLLVAPGHRALSHPGPACAKTITVRPSSDPSLLSADAGPYVQRCASPPQGYSGGRSPRRVEERARENPNSFAEMGAGRARLGKIRMLEEVHIYIYIYIYVLV